MRTWLAGTLTCASVLISPLAVPAGAMTASDSPACTIVGSNRADRLTGTVNNDVICGLGGNDTINGLGGNDVILGGAGNDRIDGGAGNDTIQSGDGNDTVNGGAGNDSIESGAGNDTANGGVGNDDVFGDAGRDRLRGDGGDDLLIGGYGNDDLAGGQNNDQMGGGTGSDSIQAGVGQDICAADAADSMRGACTLDNSSPEVVSLMEQAVFTAGEEAVFSWSIADTVGVEQSWLFIGGPSGWVTDWCGFDVQAQRVGGTTQSGTYEARCAIPGDAVNQTYTAFIYANDVFGHSIEGGLQVDFSVSGGSADSEAPQVSDISFNVSSGTPGSQIELKWTASDETGVARVTPWLALDGYGFADTAGLYADTLSQTQVLLSGDSLRGTYSQIVTFREDAPAGTYTLWLSVADVLGNRTFEQYPLTVVIAN